MFTKILTGGRGGDGCVSFSRGPNRRRGPARGGDGGHGGDVIVSVNQSLQVKKFFPDYCMQTLL